MFEAAVAPAAPPRPARRVELGDPRHWAPERARNGVGTGRVPGPVVRTAAEMWVALYSEDGALVGAVGRWCPHRGADLLIHAGFDSCPGALKCRHAGYSWWIASGEVRSLGGLERAGAIALHRVCLRPDGTAYIDVEEDVCP